MKLEIKDLWDPLADWANGYGLSFQATEDLSNILTGWFNPAVLDYEALVGKKVEMAWKPEGPWYPRYLVAYLPDAERSFFGVKSLRKGYAPSAWGYCRELQK